MVAVEEWRECNSCGDKLPLDRHHYAVASRRKDGGECLSRKCRRCRAQSTLEADKAMRSNPATRDAYLAKRREINKRWLDKHPERKREYNRRSAERRTPEQQEALNRAKRERYPDRAEEHRQKERERYHRNPERVRAKQRAAYRRMKKDKKRWRHYLAMQRRWREENRERVLENRRIWTRLKAEREGRAMRPGKPRPEPRITLPVVEPLSTFIERLVNAYGQLEAAAMAGVDGKIIRQIVMRQGTLTLNVADTICTRLNFNLFDFWPETLDD